jgi:asparagine synthase (glutamine-hydrolysing)
MKDDPCVQSSHHLHDLLTNVISKILTSSEAIGVLFSGGLDSAIITAILSELHSTPFHLFVAGISSAKDIALAHEAAEVLNLPLTIQVFTADDVQEMLPPLLSILSYVDVMHVELAIPIFFAAKCAYQFGVSTLFSGQGADELFGGYSKYEELLYEFGEGSTIKEMQSDFNTLREQTLPLMESVISHFDLQLVAPYLDNAIIDFASLLPFSCKIVQSSENVIRKRVLRLLAADLNLPSRIVNAPKRALQYGSGAHRILSTLAANHWRQQNPNLTQREARTHARVKQYLELLIDC